MISSPGVYSKVQLCLPPLPLCAHCGSAVSSNSSEVGTPLFCCSGCETVYSILNSRGLEQYYSLKKMGGYFNKPSPATELNQTYSYLDDPEFRKLYATENGAGQIQMTFFLEGVHCVACIWLLEKLPRFVDDVISVSLDMSHSTALVRLCKGGAFAAVAQEFHRLGYRPHPVRGGEHEEHQRRENRLMLIRTGLAGACTGNIMLLALSVYGGASGHWALVFNWLSFALFLPVAFFSAVPFYKAAWTALRTRSVSIDVPIVLGIIFGSIASFANLLTGSDHIYFDSLSALVFLLLASRYVLKRAQQNALQSSKLLHFLTPSVVRRKNPRTDLYEETSMDFINAGDVIEVRAGESIPIDGTVLTGSANLNCALLTGESEWVKVGVGENVFAGTVNQDSALSIKVSASGYGTRLGQILKAVEEGAHRKAPIVTLADRVSKRFVSAVLVLSVGVFIGAWYLAGIQEGLNRALAMVIITCPCALALATPLALTMSLGRAAKKGILIKGADVLERLSQIDSVFLDKTGTITTGNFEVLEWRTVEENARGSDADDLLAALALESRSNHPVARAILRHFPQIPATRLPQVDEFCETVGTGVSGRIGGSVYELRQADEVAVSRVETRVSFLKNGSKIAEVLLGDRVREDSKSSIEKLRALGLDVHILSGDNELPVMNVVSQLGVPRQNAMARMTPERKCQVIQEHPRALMAGDGANDAVALSAAFVGVAVHGGMEVSLRAADAYLSSSGVHLIHEMIVGARETMKVLYRNLGFSLVYNMVGGGLALFGKVDPLFAAVLMPLSAFTVFISSIVGTKRLRGAA